jgi:hypothetical protein
VQGYHFWLKPFSFMPTFLAVQLAHKTSDWCNLILVTMPPFPLHVIFVRVVLVGAERATADRVLERDNCVLAADCAGSCLLHLVEERKEVSQGKSTSLSSSTLYSVNGTAALMSKWRCTVYR